MAHYKKGFDGPPDNHIPPRSPIDMELVDDDVLEKLRSFGYSDEDIVLKLSNATPNPIKATYYLVEEFYARDVGAKVNFIGWLVVVRLFV